MERVKLRAFRTVAESGQVRAGRLMAHRGQSDQLPTIRKLAEELVMNSNTVLRASSPTAMFFSVFVDHLVHVALDTVVGLESKLPAAFFCSLRKRSEHFVREISLECISRQIISRATLRFRALSRLL